MITRIASLVVLALSFACASAQSSNAVVPVRAVAFQTLDAPLDVSAAEQTLALLDALVRGDRRPLAEAVAEHRTDRAAADFGRYLDAVTGEIGALRAYRLVRIQTHDRGATAVLAEVEGAHGTDVLRFVWRGGDLVLLNRGVRTVR